jgi:hypothetical protein
MKGNGRVDLETVSVSKNGQMDHIIRGIGILVLPKEMAHFTFAMVSNIKGIGQTIWRTEKEYFIMKMEIYMKANF